jgi:hypothetical protein
VTALALQGTLDTFSLPDVLRLLATTSKTGRLRIEGDRGQGSVWLSDGEVVDADADRATDGTPVDEVVFELLRFTTGSFAFDGGDTPAGSGESEEVEALLRRASALLSEWSELETVVPSLEHEVSLAGDLSVDEVTIDADRWRSVVAVAAGRTVGELATTLGLTELGVSRAVRDLVDLGVADVGAPGSGAATERSVPAPAPLTSAPTTSGAPRSPLPPRAVPEGVAPVGGAPVSGEPQRAGWRTGDRTGEITVARDLPGGTSNGQAPPSRDQIAPSAPPPVTPPPAPPGPAAKGGLASRLGRNRGASAASRSSEPPTTGSTPSVGAGSGRTPEAPTARSNESARPRSTPPDAVPAAPERAPGRAPADGPDSRSRSTGPTLPSRSPGSAGPAGPSRPGATPRPAVPGPGSPDPGPATPGPGPSPFDRGRLGPSPIGPDTGQIRPVSPSSLPPDLHWAADDSGSAPLNGGPPASPFSGLSSLGPGPTRPVPAKGDGEIAPHVAAMSPQARAAVQATVGNAGGSTGAGGSQGEDIAQRGRLISFLSTVR